MNSTFKIYFTYTVLIVEHIRRIFLSYNKQRCAKVDRDPQDIWDPRKDCGPFV